MRLAILSAFVLGVVALVAQDQREEKVPEVGQAAPTIRLNDHTGKAAELGGEADRWTVLAFYPKALTPG